MINQVVVRKLFVDRLAEVFGPPKNPDVVVKELMKVMPSEATDDGLERLANEVVQSRRAKSFPSLSELIQIVARLSKSAVTPRTGNGYNPNQYSDEGRREWQGDEVVKGLRGTPLARQAIEEGWAVGLTDMPASIFVCPNPPTYPPSSAWLPKMTAFMKIQDILPASSNCATTCTIMPSGS